ncbi:MAG: protein jag [Tissierellia bacterium]|nr:protein jag [Tissierellia bacterium]
MSVRIFTGKSIKDALIEASEELGIPVEDIDYSVLEQGKSGFLGIIGSKDAVIRVENEVIESKVEKVEVLLEEPEAVVFEEVSKAMDIPVETVDSVIISNEKVDEEQEIAESEPVDKIEAKVKTFLEPILENMVNRFDISVRQEEDRVYVTIENNQNDNFGILIGKRGVTLDALQYLLSIVVNQNEEDYLKVILDTEDYRKKREKALIELANRMANQAIRQGKRTRLNPMNPFERRVIHTALQTFPGVTTYSEGKEPYRRIVIEVEK